MNWIMRFLRWLFGVGPAPAKYPGGEWLGAERIPREHQRSRLHRGWHREPKRPPWCKSSKLTSGVR
jgi:hypothetical protein